jgi:hypothetical protein
VLPGTAKPSASKAKTDEEKETIEYSSREVKPPILLLGDLLRAHSTFLLHHASSLSALFVRTRRSKFVAILGRFWDTYLSTWNVLMQGNPANNLYGGIKLAACGELGVGVGEEDRGSGEREVLEGFVGRIEGLVDVVVSKFGDGDSSKESENTPGKRAQTIAKPTAPWLGSGEDPAAEDGAVFLGTGALSRKSLRDVSHWIEDLYRWGPYAYGVIDNPSSNRRSKKTNPKADRGLSPETKQNTRQVYGLSIRDKAKRQNSLKEVPPKPMGNDETNEDERPQSKDKRPTIKRAFSSRSFNSTESDSNKTNKYMSYLKLGYGTHWSLGSSSSKQTTLSNVVEPPPASAKELLKEASIEGTPHNESDGHYLIGLLGSIEDEVQEAAEEDTENNHNERLLLRTLTLELEREVDARAEADISIDFSANDNDTRASSKRTGSEKTGTSATSFESQDRNKTKKLRVVVYIKKPFIFVFLFELRSDALAFGSLYRSLHYQVGPLHRPLLNSTSYRASRPDLEATSEDAKAPIFDLVYDPKTLTITSTIPNIPDPFQFQSKTNEPLPWSRIEALNTHMQIINTYIATTTTDRSELERTCKTSRGWWVVWTRVPDTETSTPRASGVVKIPTLIPEDSTDSAVTNDAIRKNVASTRTSTFGASMTSGPAHPFLETPSTANEHVPKDKEIFLIRRASDYVPAKAAGRFVSGSSTTDAWASGPGKLAQGIGVDTKRYIEGLLNLNR